MTERNDDDPVPTSTEQMKEIIAEEVGKAIEGSLFWFIYKIQNTVLSLVEERVKRLEDSVNLMKEKSGERKGCSYKEFMRTGQLKVQAKDWWGNKKKEIGAEAARVMTWDEFKVPFLKHHSPKAVINRIKEEFIQLRQKGETIDTITGIFMDKLRFCDELVTTEEQKIYYYYNMLSAEYREFMTPSKYETLTEIINTAREREIGLKKQIERGERRAQDVNPSPTKKARTAESAKKTDAKGGSPSCKEKSQFVINAISLATKKSECPDLVGKRLTKESPSEALKAKARSFQLTAAEAKTEPDVVSGIFTINSIPACVLFDMGANKSFISYGLIRHPSFVLTKLSIPLKVELGDNRSFIVCDICQDCKLGIDDEEYSIDLIPMSMGEFQVVVGMDWLSRHRAKVVCFRKEIKLTSPSRKHVTIFGEKGGNPIICSMLKAHKLMKHGCRAFIIYANEAEKELLKIGDLPVVRDFEDVFPEDLPRIPPEWEVEFGIELVPGVKPVAKALYHASIGMAPYEMLYGRKCRTPVCWGEVGPRELAHKEVVQATNEKIDVVRAHLKAAQDRQKSYAEKRRKPIEFQEGDMVMLKVSPWKGVIRFRKRGN
ncbi:uncharacterized protein LOC110925006 [Helianthus annuus]|uniref:uncharacterized protein LOC110925006 n=1 Tax=Helianthus annuus TaxID=4232 RepID=UPI000B8F272B|nr:uncharacterized protein LOC110925006 [Helianthus annuus]